jgi:hypothetical protein
MEQELREVEILTRELLTVLEGFWSECHGGASGEARLFAEENQAEGR